MLERFAVIVIGGGHAGVEAAVASASVLASAHGSESPEAQVALVTMDPSKIGTMSCNPAIGGLAKGQMVREIDALGGVMALAADATGIMFKVLNASKGPAVRGPRAQCDKYAYAAEVQRLVATRSNITVIAGTVDELLVEPSSEERDVGRPRVVGVVVTPVAEEGTKGRRDRGTAGERERAKDGERENGRVPTREVAVASSPIRLLATSVVLTTGTFMRALMHTGEERTAGGRVGEGSAVGISHALRALGFELGRLKTGTPPRLRRGMLDWDAIEPQRGDEPAAPFSDLSPAALVGGRFPVLRQVECRITGTTAAVHDAIRANIHRAPMYSGQVDAECGPRYCPSIEDKVVRFGDRDRHQVFLEPESLSTDEIYCNGISTSLPAEVQDLIVRGMPGCERAEILRYGYAVEYDMVWPHQIDATCETKRVAGLFLAGQINGTSGYEEAAGQGLVAGLNAAQRTLGHEAIRLGREQAYLGVMMDDLVTKTPREPYRMFTSRAEHRLILRSDNAAERLTALGRELGLVDDVRWSAFERRRTDGDAAHAALARERFEGRPAVEWVRRHETTLAEVSRFVGDALGRHVDDAVIDRVMNDLRYEGYLVRANAEIRRQRETERMSIPPTLAAASICGLRREAIDVLQRFRPATLGQASRLAGINPTDIMLIRLALHRRRSA